MTAPSVSRAASADASLLRLPDRRFALGVWRWLAVAAVFVSGFIVGQLSQPKPSVEEGQRPAAGPQQPTLPTTVEGQGRMESIVPHVSPEGATRLATRPELGQPQRYTSEEHGRLIIETTLRNTGARALWVVDGAFGLTQSNGGSPS